MHKVKLSWCKLSLVTVLSLGFMVLGIGCIAWSMLSMFRFSISSTYDTELNRVMGGIAPVASKASLVLPSPDKTLYTVNPAEGDTIGSLTIPALNLELPIIQGTGVKELERGVGHFTQSVLPGEKDNCVLSGHRETVFRQLGNLKIGDTLIVQTVAGIFPYEVTGMRIVHEDDKTVIVPTDHAVLTLTTCYPFNTPGYFPDRYIVSSALVKSN
ncbi:MAG: class D sortase [Desulfosporosinus sp.]|nr:class D sortase [Desulfosporosinus sp.]